MMYVLVMFCSSDVVGSSRQYIIRYIVHEATGETKRNLTSSLSILQRDFYLFSPQVKTATFACSVGQGQTAQNVQSDLESKLSSSLIMPTVHIKNKLSKIHRISILGSRKKGQL